MVFALLFSCKKSDEEKLSGKVSKKTEVITTNTEKEISKQTAGFDKDKFYERSFLLDWNSFIPIDIVIYGNDATDVLAKEYQTGIEAAWGQDSNGNQWQTEINGKQYSVKFDVNVSVGKRPGFFTKLWNAFFGTKNYIKADRNMHRSNVVNGFLGTWRTEGRGTSLSNDNPAAHEFGHLIGFKDRYSDVSGTHLGWEGNIMGETAMRGCVEQRNIDALGGYISNKGRLRGTIRLRRMKL